MGDGEGREGEGAGEEGEWSGPERPLHLRNGDDVLGFPH